MNAGSLVIKIGITITVVMIGITAGFYIASLM